MKLDIKVVNKRRGEPGVYVGRGSPLGNPYRTGPGMPREQAIALYRRYLWERIGKGDSVICGELNRLHLMARNGPLALQCFCAPLACHADVIASCLQWMEDSVA